MRKSNLVLLLGLFCAGKISGAAAEDVLITQYTTAVSGAPFGIAIDQGYFKKRGVDITGVVSGQGGGNSVRAIIASDLGFGESTVAAGTTGSGFCGQPALVAGEKWRIRP